MVDKKKAPWDSVSYRKLSVKDIDKIRYRVYRDADDFVAVIADSALMAIKIAGVPEPLKVVRDLPHQQSAIGEEAIASQPTPVHMEIKTNTEKKKTFLETLPRVARNKDFQEINNAVFHKENADITPIIGRDAMLRLAAATTEKHAMVLLDEPIATMTSKPVTEKNDLDGIAIPTEESAITLLNDSGDAADEITPEELSPSEVARLLSEPRDD